MAEKADAGDQEMVEDAERDQVIMADAVAAPEQVDMAEKEVAPDQVDMADKIVALDQVERAEKVVAGDQVDMAEKVVAPDQVSMTEKAVAGDLVEMAENEVAGDHVDTAEKAQAPEQVDVAEKAQAPDQVNMAEKEVAPDQVDTAEKAPDLVDMAEKAVAPDQIDMAEKGAAAGDQAEGEEAEPDKVDMKEKEMASNQVKVPDKEAALDEVRVLEKKTTSGEVGVPETEAALGEVREPGKETAPEAGPEQVKVAVKEAPGEQVLQLPMSKLELDDFISAIVQKITPQDVDISNKKQLLFETLQISKAERKAKDIGKTLNQSLDKVQKYLEEMKAEEKEIEEQIRQKEKMLAMSCEVIDDDSDDDVTFIGSSFEPSKRTAQPPDSDILFIGPSFEASKTRSAEPPRQSSQQPGSAPAQQPPPLQMGPSQPPSLAHLRAALTNTLNKQTGTSQLFSVGSLSRAKSVGQVVDLSKEYSLPVWPEIAVGSKVLAKKFNDIWYSGVVLDLSKPESTKHPGEWKYRVKFDGKGMKVLTGHHIAYRDSINPNTFLKVGTRVAALYRDDETASGSSFYAGIVAEAPSFKNQKRFLVFFDDGYAQYCWAKELHKVYYQSENVWEDIHPDSQEFIKEYLKQYPERPMVRLMNGQIVKTEWNGRWWTARVMEVDASLVKMYFQADKRTEWIYRGSTRLEPLFKALANAEAIKAAGTSKGRRLNMDPKGPRKPTVEYTRGLSTDDDKKGGAAGKPPTSKVGEAMPSPSPSATVGAGREKKRPVARKSTAGNSNQFKPNKGPRSLVAEENFPGYLAGWEPPWLKNNRRQAGGQQKKATSSGGPKGFEASSISSNKQGRDMASVLQERLATAADQSDCVDDKEAMGERIETVIDNKGRERKKFVPHTCDAQCVKESEEELDKLVGKPPLLFPLLCGWERQINKMRPGGRKSVIYRATCGRRLRSIEEVDDFLSITDSQLFIDHFCFDPWLHVHTDFVPVKTFCDIKDLSYGKEKVPISCVNAIDRQYPDYVEYSSYRIPAKGVKIPLDDEFLQCCDCTDNCKDRTKCACQQLTIENTTWIGERDPSAGYHHRRLREPIFTGVVECNSRCKCDQRCRNRVAQNGLSCRLQVFKTEKRGWGLRCLNDIPKGGFICIYAGQLLTDMGANDDGKQYGDEYLAELDFIEVVERQKEGYESDVEDPDDNIVNDNAEEEDDDDDYQSDNAGNDAAGTSDSDFEAGGSGGVESKVHATRRRKKKDLTETEQKDSKPNQAPLTKLVLKRHSNDSKEWTTEEKKAEQVGKTAKGEKMEDSPVGVGEDEDDEDGDDNGRGKRKEDPMETDELPDLDKPLTKIDEGEKKKEGNKETAKKEIKVEETDSVELCQTDSTQLSKADDSTQLSKADDSTQLSKADDSAQLSKADDSRQLSHRARKSTGGSRFKNLPNPKMPNTIPEAEEEEQKPKQGTRAYFKDSSSCYIMDAKSMGNIGRYLNHSCSPNVFVQNIFVDTHDLRFPWVAFFAGQYIRAGTELTWDYNYEVGSVPDKVLYCYCGSPMCRGRLL